MPETIEPTSGGRDLDNKDRKYDAHLRIDVLDGKPQICADVFNSNVKNAKAAHVESRCEPNTEDGANDITEFLQYYAFDVVVRPKP